MYIVKNKFETIKYKSKLKKKNKKILKIEINKRPIKTINLIQKLN